MAREHQGLQIMLIIFAMLAVVLGVTTYVGFDKYNLAEKKAKESLEDKAKADGERNQRDDEIKELKRLMGFAATKTLKDVRDQFDADMKTGVAAGTPEDACFYHPILEKLVGIIKNRTTELADTKAEIQELKDKITGLEATIDSIAKTFNASVKASADEVASVTAQAAAERTRILDDEANLNKTVEKVRKDSKVAIDRAEAKVQEVLDKMAGIATLNTQQNKKLKSLQRTNIDVPCGEIRWVNQQSQTVWIDKGRADGLERQVSFGVYPGDATNLAKAGVKASVEVTKILGDHMAEARILDDKISDPIMPGDKIFTPLWSPGQKKHFALVGFLDLNDEGLDDHDAVRNLITMNGGIVDCELDPKGKQIREMTINTDFLVRGEEPSIHGQPEMIAGFSRMITEAEKLGVRVISLTELKQQLGYRNRTPVKHFSRGGVLPTPRKAPGGGAPAPKAAPAEGEGGDQEGGAPAPKAPRGKAPAEEEAPL